MYPENQYSNNQDRALQYLQSISEYVVYGQKKYRGKELVAAGKLDDVIKKLLWLESYIKTYKEV